MKTGKSGVRFTLLLLAILVWGSAAMPAAQALDLGQPAPALELPGSGDKPVRLADWQGKLVFVDFWASWCGPCRQEFPWLNAMQAKYGERGLQVVGINLDKHREDAQQFLNEVPAKFTVAFDAGNRSAREYGVRGMPTSVLIGPDGKVIAVHAGFQPEDATALEAKILTALPGKAK